MDSVAGSHTTNCGLRLVRYVVGKSTSDDPAEEKRQKAFKSILNKLTPDNFQKMYTQVSIVSALSVYAIL